MIKHLIVLLPFFSKFELNTETLLSKTILFILLPFILASNVRRDSLIFYPLNNSDIDVKQQFLIEMMLHRINSGKDFEVTGFRLFLISKKDSIELVLVDSVPTKAFTHYFLYSPIKKLQLGLNYKLMAFRPYYEDKNEQWVNFSSSESIYAKKRYLQTKRTYITKFDEKENFKWAEKPVPNNSWFKFVSSDGNLAQINFDCKIIKFVDYLFKLTFYDTTMKVLHVTYKVPDKKNKFFIKEEFGYGDFLFACCSNYYVKIEVLEFGNINEKNTVDKLKIMSPVPKDQKKYGTKKYKLKYN